MTENPPNHQAIVTRRWTRYDYGWLLLAGAGGCLLGVGILALIAAAAVSLLPHEQAYLNANLHDLQAHHHDGTLIGFMVHNRVAFAGALLITGWLYLWLAAVPLRQGESWAWWSLLASGYLGGSSYLVYFRHGYIDSWHAAGTVGIMSLMTVGLALTYRRPVVSRLSHAWQRIGIGQFERRFEIGRILMMVWAAATAVGGTLVLLTGLFPIFVPEDLAYMQTTAVALEAVSPRLLPFMAHDRIGFGGALVAWGTAALAGILFGLSRDSGQLAIWLTAAWLVAVLSAIMIHPVVGYNSLSHLLPFIAKDSLFLVGIILATAKRE